MKSYAELLEERVLEHRYRYYSLDAPVISDLEYDDLEKCYEKACLEEGRVNILEEHGIDFQHQHPKYLEAKNRVDTKTDNFSLWMIRMAKVWNKLGWPEQFIKFKNIYTSNGNE